MLGFRRWYGFTLLAPRGHRPEDTETATEKNIHMHADSGDATPHRGADATERRVRPRKRRRSSFERTAEPAFAKRHVDESVDDGGGCIPGRETRAEPNGKHKRRSVRSGGWFGRRRWFPQD